MTQLLPLLVVLPLGAAFCATIMAQAHALRRLAGILAIAAVAGNLALACLSFTSGNVNLYVGGWGPHSTLGIEMVCDGLTRLMLLTINLVALAALVFAGPYMKRFTRVWLFDALLLLMIGAMNGVVLAGDMFNLFVFLRWPPSPPTPWWRSGARPPNSRPPSSTWSSERSDRR